MRTLVAVALLLAAAAPAFAGEPGRSRLVAGGIDPLDTAGGTRAELLTAGPFSFGAQSDATAGHMALGGFVAYAVQDTLSLSSSLMSAPSGQAYTASADIVAAYSGGLLGLDGTTALRLGYDWATTGGTFSPNLQHSVLGDAGYHPAAGDLSLSLSFTHPVTPSLSLGGFAAASRAEYESGAGESDFRLGAGLGVRF
ncbi:hypothetical protein [Magnetospirillum sp. UT-4]|uniref:hypothetical protein n=1 Tax=Magnetospirillum sp. UT-4 TaxID=2681467 RepID=UPI001385CCD1|nr:hypothetical protein [Magnetospirillum sp. UT-4]CAA7612821.1 conserved exported hypothetical protein [Magnetospirillum sp. UT-4]